MKHFHYMVSSLKYMKYHCEFSEMYNSKRYVSLSLLWGTYSSSRHLVIRLTFTSKLQIIIIHPRTQCLKETPSFETHNHIFTHLFLPPYRALLLLSIYKILGNAYYSRRIWKKFSLLKWSGIFSPTYPHIDFIIFEIFKRPLNKL